jgi:uncharacterized LabA/DUF88 family protein
MNSELNLAFIDGQNLHLGIIEQGWKIDHRKFRMYLKEKYHVAEAYYFLGFAIPEQQLLYESLQHAGFVLLFREHSSASKGAKKGNVDTDIIFEVMKTIIERKDFHKVLIVSGDGDYKKMVNYLIKKHLFKTILFPNRNFASALYRRLPPIYFDHLDSHSIRAKIEYI